MGSQPATADLLNFFQIEHTMGLSQCKGEGAMGVATPGCAMASPSSGIGDRLASPAHRPCAGVTLSGLD
jgi:hypothetical protein